MSRVTSPALESDFDGISLTRSDGIKYDLLTVFSTKSAAGADLIHDITSCKETTEEVDHGNISISRSDGINHDIIKVFNKDTGETEQKQKPRRSLSLGKIELPSFLLNTFSSKNITANTSPIPQKFDNTYYPKSVRIVHMSDTHNFLNRLNKNRNFLPSGDILVHSGDFSNGGTDEEYLQFNEWLGSVSGKYHYRIICLGNHDVKLGGNVWEGMKKKLSNATHVLCHEEAVVLGIRFYGCPWHWGHKSNYSVRPGAPTSTSGGFDHIPEGTQVLITHGPAYDRLDVTTAAENKEHWGSRDLAEAIRRVKPGLHLHGHTKDSRGILLPFGNSPLTVNSSMTEKSLSVLYACPHVVKAVQVNENSLSNNAPPSWTFSMDTLE